MAKPTKAKLRKIMKLAQAYKATGVKHPLKEAWDKLHKEPMRRVRLERKMSVNKLMDRQLADLEGRNYKFK